MGIFVIGQIRIIDQEKWNDYKRAKFSQLLNLMVERFY